MLLLLLGRRRITRRLLLLLLLLVIPAVVPTFVVFGSHRFDDSVLDVAIEGKVSRTAA